VTVNFVVDANGKIKNAKVVKGVSEALDAEALRVVENAPDWTPAKQGGKNVPVTYSIPVTFAIK
jgi:protein TonB